MLRSRPHLRFAPAAPPVRSADSGRLAVHAALHRAVQLGVRLEPDLQTDPLTHCPCRSQTFSKEVAVLRQTLYVGLPPRTHRRIHGGCR
jgi:hypothetical protein